MTAITYRQALCGPLKDPAEAVAALEHEGWKARADVAPWPLSMPLDWAADPFEDRNWRFQLNAWRPVEVLITAHALLKDDVLLDGAIDLMLDWARHEAAQPDEALLWNDMGTGLRAAKLAYVLTQPALDEPGRSQVREQLIDLARRHMLRLRDRSFIGESNHGLFQVHGLMALIQALPEAPESQGGREYVETVFAELLRQQFGGKGVHLEHSPGYHLFALKTIRRFAGSGWYDSMPEIQRIISTARKTLAWFIFPDGRLSGIGDSSRLRLKTVSTSQTSVVGRFFQEAGYAVIRNSRGAKPRNASMLLVTGGHHSNVHKHADDLSFEWFVRGRDVIVDTGKYSYSRAKWRAYTDSAAAHNALDLIRESQNNGVRRTPPAGGLLQSMQRTRWGWAVRGAFARPGFGVRHQRVFLYWPGRRLVLLDTVACQDAREVTAWLHLAPDLTAERQVQNPGWTFPGGRIDYVGSAPGALARHRGEEAPIQGWMATGYHQRVPNDALGLTMVGTDMRLATVISMDDAPDLSIELVDKGFRVRDEDGDVLFEDDQAIDVLEDIASA